MGRLYRMSYAIIKNNTITNVIVANPHSATQIAKSQDAIAVYVDRFPVQIGDTYTDGKFYRDEIEIERTPTPEEEVAKLRAEFDAKALELQIALAEIAEVVVDG